MLRVLIRSSLDKCAVQEKFLTVFLPAVHKTSALEDECMGSFINDQFMLKNKTAVRLYEKFAEKMPIYDYHCHLSPKDIAENRKFNNITELWLEGDHYKWRAMRAHGLEEKYITGDASDKEKFAAWAETVPYTLGNPLYHWTHLELKRYFD